MYICNDSQFYNYCSSSVEDFVNRESRRISMHFKCFTYFLKDLSVLIITSWYHSTYHHNIFHFALIFIGLKNHRSWSLLLTCDRVGIRVRSSSRVKLQMKTAHHNRKHKPRKRKPSFPSNPILSDVLPTPIPTPFSGFPLRHLLPTTILNPTQIRS